MVKQVILMRTDLKNTQGNKVKSGKLMAQAAHASMIWLSKRVQWMIKDAEKSARDPATYFTNQEREWLDGAFTKIVLEVHSESELRELVDKARATGITAHICTDAGNTEFGGVPTVTCAALGPETDYMINGITGHLKTL